MATCLCVDTDYARNTNIMPNDRNYILLVYGQIFHLSIAEYYHPFSQFRFSVIITHEQYYNIYVSKSY